MNLSEITQALMFVASLLGPVQAQDYDTEKYKLNEAVDTLKTEAVQKDTLKVIQTGKVAIAVMELDANGITEAEGKALSDRLRIEIFNVGIFVVMERDKMNKILDEMQFQMSGCTSDECVVEIGRIVGVKKMIAGSVSKVGEIYSVSVRLIDVETSKIEATAIEDIEGSLGTVLTKAVPSVAKQISGLERPTMDLPIKKSAFNISTQPFDADIYMDGVYYGRSPITIEAKPDMTHRLTALADNYEKWERYYDLKSGQQLEVDVVLTRKAETAVPEKQTEPRQRRKFDKGFKIRYTDLHITQAINKQVRLLNNEIAEGNSLFYGDQVGSTVFKEKKQCSGIELYNLRQLGDGIGFDFGLGLYRSEFAQWIKNFDGTYNEPTLLFWMPTLNLNLRLAPIRYPLFYPYFNVGLGYNVLILDAVNDNTSMGSPIFQDWGLIYGAGVEVRPFKFIGIALEWDHRVMKYKLMDIDNNATERFKDDDITSMDLSGNNVGLSINLYY